MGKGGVPYVLLFIFFSDFWGDSRGIGPAV
jgi:hypothetical protein